MGINESIFQFTVFICFRNITQLLTNYHRLTRMCTPVSAPGEFTVPEVPAFCEPIITEPAVLKTGLK